MKILNLHQLLLLTLFASNSLEATSFVRRAVRALVSNSATRALAKPATKGTLMQFYKKHPWLVKGTALALTAITVKKGHTAYTKYRNNKYLKQRAHEAIQYASTLQNVPYRSPLMQVAAGLWAHWSTEENRIEIIKGLLLCGVDINQKNSDGSTALMLAADKGFSKVVAFLIEANADLNAQDNCRRTALMRRVAYYYDKDYDTDFKMAMEVANLLVKAGAKLNLTDDRGCTALDIANGSLWRGEPVRMLFNAGAIGKSYHTNANLLRKACEYCWPEVIEKLIEQGANIDEPVDGRWRSPLMIAADSGQLAIVQLLLNHGAHVNGANRYGETPLMYAAQQPSRYAPKNLKTYRSNKLAIVQACIKAGADLNAVDSRGNTALTLAAYACFQDFKKQEHTERIEAPKIFKKLIRAGAHVEPEKLKGIRDQDGLWKIIAEETHNRRNLRERVRKTIYDTELIAGSKKDATSIILDYMISELPQRQAPAADEA